jgi:DNA-binding LacI/PurR family transcriptional regulator
VIGCGNLRLSSYLEVPLSSIDQSTQQQGEEAAELALSLINGNMQPASRNWLVAPQLVARASTIGRS